MHKDHERVNLTAQIIVFVIICLATAVLIFAIAVIADGLTTGNVIFIAHIQQPVITPTLPVNTPAPTLPAGTPTPTVIR